MKKFSIILVGILVLMLSGSLVVAQGKPIEGKGKVQSPEIETVVFIDYAAPQGPPTPGPYGMACPATDNSEIADSYSFTRGGIKWSAFPVTYRFTGTIPSETEVNAAFETWDDVNGDVGVDNFFKYDSSAANTVSWGTIDGPGGAIAMATVSYYPFNKTIVAFSIVFDSEEDWGIGEGEFFDIQNISAHEIGHVVGLDHVNSPKDCWLTMYRYGLEGETSKRTLGLGDELGIKALY